MKPTCVPPSTMGRTVRSAGNVDPSRRWSLTSSSNLPFSTASRRRRGTRVGTFFGRWNAATDIRPITRSRGQPNSSSASAAYCWTVPVMSHVMTDTFPSNSPSGMGSTMGTRYGYLGFYGYL